VGTKDGTELFFEIIEVGNKVTSLSPSLLLLLQPRLAVLVVLL
jgi:hypothetical protein